MSQYPGQASPDSGPTRSGQTVVVQTQPTNGLGIAGFVCSLLGLVSCGLLSPIGLLLSLIAMFKPPRGFAIAGLIISIVGSIALVAFGFTLFAAAVGISTVVEMTRGMVQTYTAMQEADAKIAAWQQSHAGLPSPDEGAEIIDGVTDGWGTQLRYVLVEDGYDIRSAGSDGQFETGDDLWKSNLDNRPRNWPDDPEFDSNAGSGSGDLQP